MLIKRDEYNNTKFKKIWLVILIFISNMTFASNNIPLNSDLGAKMLVNSMENNYAAQFLAETKYFTYQENTSFCAIATAAIVLNTLGIISPDDKTFGKYKLFTQTNIFTDDLTKKTGISESMIINRGLSLSEENKLLNSFGDVNSVMYPIESNLNYKEIIIEALKSNSHLVVANVSRNGIQQSGGGHLSPIVAYDPKTDSVLFMDVASYQPYGPTWISFDVLYQGMHTKDGNNYRGFLVVSKKK